MADTTLAVGGLVATIGLADSVNPTTVGPAMALAIQENGARRAAAFTAGVALVSFAGGAALVAGPGEAIMAAIPHPGAAVKEIGELALGVVLLALAVLAWVGRHRIERGMARAGGRSARGSGLGGAFALGAGIMAVELPTAFPYFGAIAAVVGTGASLPSQLLLVVVFNVVLVLPLLAIVGVRAAAGEQATERLERIRDALARSAGIVLAVLLAAGGIALIVVGLVG